MRPAINLHYAPPTIIAVGYRGNSIPFLSATTPPNFSNFNPDPFKLYKMKKIILTPLLFITLTCFSQTDASIVTFVNPPSVHAPKGYSQAAVVDLGTCKMVILSGQVALDTTGKLIGGLFGFSKQAKQVFTNIKNILESQGGKMDNLVKLNFYVVNLNQLATLREIRDNFVNTRNPPASTLVQVKGFFREDILLEVDSTAIIPKNQAYLPVK
jgi:2-iminobutanoate/2-iminopropanoate deaminase